MGVVRALDGVSRFTLMARSVTPCTRVVPSLTDTCVSRSYAGRVIVSSSRCLRLICFAAVCVLRQGLHSVSGKTEAFDPLLLLARRSDGRVGQKLRVRSVRRFQACLAFCVPKPYFLVSYLKSCLWRSCSLSTALSSADFWPVISTRRGTCGGINEKPEGRSSGTLGL